MEPYEDYSCNPMQYYKALWEMTPMIIPYNITEPQRRQACDHLIQYPKGGTSMITSCNTKEQSGRQMLYS